MKSGLAFSLPSTKSEADGILGLLKEVFTLINEDKEEQAIDPEAFTGNLKDYPDWVRDACRDRALVGALENFCEFDPGELAEWSIEEWYEELSTCDALNFQIRKRRDEKYELVYDVAEEHYGGDIAPAWILLAAGASKVVCLPLQREDV